MHPGSQTHFNRSSDQPINVSAMMYLILFRDNFNEIIIPCTCYVTNCSPILH